jgi:hypothetical protein
MDGICFVIQCFGPEHFILQHRIVSLGFTPSRHPLSALGCCCCRWTDKYPHLVACNVLWVSLALVQVLIISGGKDAEYRVEDLQITGQNSLSDHPITKKEAPSINLRPGTCAGESIEATSFDAGAMCYCMSSD